MDNNEREIELSAEELMEFRLWSYIDGLGSAAERSAIMQLLNEHAAWREKYKELLEVHHSLTETELEQPSMRFTQNLMEEIARLQIAPATRKYINNKIIYGITAFFFTLIIGFLGYGFSQLDWSGGGSGKIGGIDFSQVDYSRMFNNSFVNSFMMINIILGLMLLDRYLGQRKKDWQTA